MKIKNKLSNLAWRRLRSRGLLVAVGAAALLAAACTDDDLATDKSNKHTGTALAFNVSDMQMDALAQNGAGQTRGLSMQPIPASYLAPRKIDATGSNPHDFCLIESTVEGLNPVKVDAKTRGTILTASTLGTFSSIGYRAASPTAAANPSTALLWFHGEKTNPDGTLQSRYDWDWPVNVYGRFYAVSPEATAANGITLSPSNYAQVPYVDFEVKQDVEQQVDLMTACSGEVHYEHGNDPTSNLKFTHALAAVKFSIGSNLSPVIIEKIEVSGVKYKGRYELPNALNAMGTWTSVNNATTTVTLDGINMNAAEMPNTMLAGALNPATNPNNRSRRDAYTFLMIPQTLPARGATNPAKVTIYYQDNGVGKHISFPLTGEWKANTTREYKLSQKNSSWEYHFTLDGDLSFNYNETAAKPFKVESWREGGSDPVTGTIAKQAIPWKVVKYEEWDYTANGGAGGWIDKGTTKPDWLNNVQTEGNGAAGSAESVNASVKAATMVDNLQAYNDVLKNEPAKGSVTPWNLSNPDTGGSDIIESANSYLISAPGHYRIPLVYGNGILNNKYNRSAYHTNNTGANILQDFVDHADQPISKALINEQNSTDKATNADIVWTEYPNLIHFSSTPIKSYAVNVKDATGATAATQVDFVEFEVKQSDIRNGNAVIAVKNSAGTVMWSWHLWFAQAQELDLIPVKNHDGVIYKFTRSILGAVHTKYESTSYFNPRKVRLTIEQQMGNNHQKNTSEITIVQTPNSVQEDLGVMFQGGRKDALPGDYTVNPANGFAFVSGRNHTYGESIRRPNVMFSKLADDSNNWIWNWNKDYYINSWSMNNTTYNNWSNDPIVKTIYDPCPAGFHLPASKAFTGFTTTGGNIFGVDVDGINMVGEFKKGMTFKTGIGNSTIYFPALGWRFDTSGDDVEYNGDIGYYWTALPSRTSGKGFYVLFFESFPDASFLVNFSDSHSCAYAFGIRPVAESRTKVKPKVPGSTEEGWEDGGDLDGGEYEL